MAGPASQEIHDQAGRNMPAAMARFPEDPSACLLSQEKGSDQDHIGIPGKPKVKGEP